MADYYFDSSAIIKRYVSETGSAWVESLVNLTAGNNIFMARITGVEVVAAIARRLRGGSMTQADASAALTIFQYDFANSYFKVEITPTLLSSAMVTAEKYALRGYDAVQLTAALELRAELLATGGSPPAFISADIDLNAAALTEGLTVDNPNAHP